MSKPRDKDLKLALALGGHHDPRCGTCARRGKLLECPKGDEKKSLDSTGICEYYTSFVDFISGLKKRKNP